METIDRTKFITKEYRPFLEFWKGKMALVEEGFTFGNVKAGAQGRQWSNYTLKLDSSVAGRVFELVKGNDTGIFVTLMTGFYCLFARYTGEETIIVDTPLIGINNKESFSDKVTIIQPVQQSKSIKELLIAMQQGITESYKYQNFPVGQMLNGSDLEQLTNIAASFSNIHPASVQRRNYDLLLNIERNTNDISVTFSYNTAVFEDWFIRNMAAHYQQMLVSFSELATVPKNVKLLSTEERQQLITEFNSTSCGYPQKLLHELFEEQVLQTPDNIALVADDCQLTYRELNNLSNQLAHFLRNEYQIKRDDIIGLLTDRSEWMLISILAVLKSGGSYLPIDPEYPEDRIRYTIEDSGCKLVLTRKHLKEHLPGTITTIDVEDPVIQAQSSENPQQINEPEDLCYIIYTSGSTGNPKGVMIQHYNVVRLFLNDRQLFDFNEKDVWPLFHSYCFDFSVWEMYGALLFGGKLVVVPKRTAQNPTDFLELIKKEKITVLNQTPGAFYNIIREEIASASKDLQLRYVIFGGEALHPARLKEWHEKYPGTKLVNMYGITETTVHVTYKEITRKEIDAGISNIGTPIPTLSCFILDQYLNLQPVGVAGELCVGGKGLARGYLNQKELTEEKFIDNPFVPGKKLYRSGDLVRYLPDKELEYLGRIDHQVKIRGFRIELGEIENALDKHPAVKEGVVIDHAGEKDEKYLCAYYVSEPTVPGSSELREFLKQILPDHMIPSWFIPVDKIPLTGNGKVDRKALPVPENQTRINTVYVAPRNEIEEKLVKVWEEVLGIDKIGVKDNFFDLGGYSLKAAQLVAAVHKELEVEIPFAFIFNTPVVEAMAGYIASAGKTKYTAIQPGEKREYYPLSAAQRRMFILNQFKGAGTIYNMPGVLTIEGKLDRKKLEDAFCKLIRRQEVLRTSFDFVKNDAAQFVHDAVNFKILSEEVEEASVEEKIKGFIRPFDLSKAPLLRVKLLQLSTEKYILLFDMHHIISDGISMDILVKEFLAFYKGEEVPPLKIQYRDYTLWQEQLANNGKLDELEHYWLERFTGEVPVLNLPLDFPRPSLQRFEGASFKFSLDPEQTKALKSLARETGTTLYMVLLAAYKVLLSRWSGQEDIVVGSPVAGRPAPELQHIIGIFINTLALRNYPQHGLAFSEFLDKLKQNVLDDFAHQEYQFESLVEKLNLRRDTSRNPLFDTMFTFGTEDEKLLKAEDLAITPYSFENKTTKFDITFGGSESEDKINFTIEYSTRLFCKETIQRLADHFGKIIATVTQNAEVKLGDIELMSDADKQQVLVDFNRTAAGFPSGETIHEQIDVQVVKAPENTALVFGSTRITYQELKQATDSLALHLQERGIKQGDIVGLTASPSIEMIYGMLGIMKAGAAYLPIDPSYPAERILHMLDDSNIQILLAEPGMEQVADFRGTIINIKDKALYQASGTPQYNSTTKNPAYIIYTSGSTGKPKGVVISHKALNNLVQWHNNHYAVTEKDRATKYAGFGFDASVWEVFPYLVKGSALYIIPDDMRLDLPKLNQYYEEKGITISFLPTQVAEQFIQLQNNTLRKLLVGGDKLNDWKKTTYEVVNNYGPTEYSVVATSFTIDKKYANIPIGKPIANTRIYILNKQNKLQPVGIPGELCIAGESLASGYLNRPELTKEKFVQDPFRPHELMYRTGDMARWLSDGNIEFLGRIDQQVKIRGFRIELGEIESVLQNHHSVKNAVVLDRKDEEGNKFLCAYIVSDEEVSPADLRQYLGKELPVYMVPAYFIALDEIPLTANGKTDAEKLRSIKLEDNVITTAEFVPPSTEIEEQLIKIWQQVLNVDRVGIRDNFFELGGNSLKVVKLLKLIEGVFPGTVEISDLFDKPTIEQLSGLIDIKSSKEEQTGKKGIKIVDF